MADANTPAGSNHRDSKEIDVRQVTRYLSRRFSQATEQVQGPARKGTKLYQYQVDFTYLIDEIQRGPKYIIPKVIQDCNEFIRRIEESTATTEGA